MKQTILGIDFDDITLDGSYEKFLGFLDDTSLSTIYTPNPEFIIYSKKDPSFRDVLNSGDLVLPDGIGVIICSRILNRPLGQRVSGIDLVKRILDMSHENPLSIYILGSRKENCSKAAANILKEYPCVNVLGCQDGYYDTSEESDIAGKIGSLAPDLLLVALGSPRQEKFIDRYKNELSGVRCAMGVGGTIDVLSGNVKPAPAVIKKAGLEWLLRACMEPKRIKRVIKLPLVIFYAIYERIMTVFSSVPKNSP